MDRQAGAKTQGRKAVVKELVKDQQCPAYNRSTTVIPESCTLLPGQAGKGRELCVA